MDSTRHTLLYKIRDAENAVAWEEFVEIYAPLIYGFAKRQGLQHADASDVVQDSMKSVASAIRNFEYDPDKGSFRSWIYTVARSKLNNHFSRNLKHPSGTGRTTVHQMIAEHPDPSEVDQWDLDYKRHLFRWAAEKVRPEFGDTVWNAFWMTAVQDIPPKEVAKDLNIDPGRVYVAKCRVLNRLKERIATASGEPGHTFF